MLSMMRDLIAHKAFANATLLRAVAEHGPAARDDELRKLLHHVILANRFWLALVLSMPFHQEEESRVPETLAGLVQQYRETHETESDWISKAEEPDLTRLLETKFFPGRKISVAEALTQVCLHSHGHRAQCLTRLRLLGGSPPVLDYVIWLDGRPEADWPRVPKTAVLS